MSGTSVDVQASISERRVVLTSMWSEAFDDYGFPAVLIVGGVVGLVLRSEPISDIPSPTAVLFLLLCVILPAYWIFASYRSYRLTRFDVLGSQEELLERALHAVDELDWTVVKEEDDVVIAYTRAGISGGQVVTIIPVPNALYVGSRNRSVRRRLGGGGGRAPFSLGQNARNIEMFRDALSLRGGIGQALEP